MKWMAAAHSILTFPLLFALSLFNEARVQVRAASRASSRTGYIRGGVEGGCPAHDVIHPQCPRLVRCLLQLMVGDGEGLVVGEGVGCGVGARGQACELGHSLLGKEKNAKALRAVTKRKSGNEGKFVRNSYEIRANFTFS